LGQKHVRFPTLIIEFRIKISMEITTKAAARVSASSPQCDAAFAC